MKKIFLTMVLFMAMQSMCLAHPWKLVEDTYVVQSGDTLKSIAQTYIEKNTYGPRNIDEFIEGILELNDMAATDIHVGSKLRINYWTKN